MTAQEARDMINQDAIRAREEYKKQQTEEKFNNIIEGIRYQCKQGYDYYFNDAPYYGREIILSRLKELGYEACIKPSNVSSGGKTWEEEFININW